MDASNQELTWEDEEWDDFAGFTSNATLLDNANENQEQHGLNTGLNVSKEDSFESLAIIQKEKSSNLDHFSTSAISEDIFIQAAELKKSIESSASQIVTSNTEDAVRVDKKKFQQSRLQPMEFVNDQLRSSQYEQKNSIGLSFTDVTSVGNEDQIVPSPNLQQSHKETENSANDIIIETNFEPLPYRIEETSVISLDENNVDIVTAEQQDDVKSNHNDTFQFVEPIEEEYFRTVNLEVDHNDANKSSGEVVVEPEIIETTNSQIVSNNAEESIPENDHQIITKISDPYTAIDSVDMALQLPSFSTVPEVVEFTIDEDNSELFLTEKNDDPAVSDPYTVSDLVDKTAKSPSVAEAIQAVAEEKCESYLTDRNDDQMVSDSFNSVDMSVQSSSIPNLSKVAKLINDEDKSELNLTETTGEPMLSCPYMASDSIDKSGQSSSIPDVLKIDEESIEIYPIEDDRKESQLSTNELQSGIQDQVISVLHTQDDSQNLLDDTNPVVASGSSQTFDKIASIEMEKDTMNAEFEVEDLNAVFSKEDEEDDWDDFAGPADVSTEIITTISSELNDDSPVNVDESKVLVDESVAVFGDGEDWDDFETSSTLQVEETPPSFDSNDNPITTTATKQIIISSEMVQSNSSQQTSDNSLLIETSDSSPAYDIDAIVKRCHKIFGTSVPADELSSKKNTAHMMVPNDWNDIKKDFDEYKSASPYSPSMRKSCDEEISSNMKHFIPDDAMSISELEIFFTRSQILNRKFELQAFNLSSLATNNSTYIDNNPSKVKDDIIQPTMRVQIEDTKGINKNLNEEKISSNRLSPVVIPNKIPETMPKNGTLSLKANNEIKQEPMKKQVDTNDSIINEKEMSPTAYKFLTALPDLTYIFS